MRELVAARFDWLEGELAQRPYIAGQRFTVADITALCAIDFGKVATSASTPRRTRTSRRGTSA